MLRTFNCGIGLVLIVPADSTQAILETLEKLGETASKIGVIEERNQAPVIIDGKTDN
jgi:phosphoribosylformylglycinamidine cyclo-ligase